MLINVTVVAKDHVERVRKAIPATMPLLPYLALKVSEETGEAIQAFNRWYFALRTKGTLAELGEELADTVICAYSLAEEAGLDLNMYIDEKDRILRRRE